MPIDPWWETNPATTPRQEIGMVSPELPKDALTLEFLPLTPEFLRGHNPASRDTYVSPELPKDALTPEFLRKML